MPSVAPHDNRETRAAFWQGARDGLPFVIVIVPFAVIFGVLATNSGWTPFQSVAMSTLVVAGASQFTALQLLGHNTPIGIVILTALAVNLRLAMYSASLAPHIGHAPAWQRAAIAYFLTDQAYGLAMNAYEQPMTARARIAYFFGTVVPICGPWYVATWAGAVAGSAIPPALALDFAVPVTFIALFAPALRRPAPRAAAIVSVVLALALSGLPYSLGLLVAAGAAMLTGAAVELWLEAWTMSQDARLWIVIVTLGIGTFLIRYSLIGLVGDRALPRWLMRLLAFVPVAVMPGLVAPLVVWPAATGGVVDPTRLVAAAAALAVGMATRNVLATIVAGMGTLYLMLWLVG